MMRTLVGVAVGGALGSLFRFGLGRSMERWNHNHFSAGILTANLLGCFLIGLLLARLAPLEPTVREALWAFLVTGFLGGLTTFSSFSLELFQLSSGALWRAAFGYALAHVGGGLLGVALGYKLGMAG